MYRPSVNSTSNATAAVRHAIRACGVAARLMRSTVAACTILGLLAACHSSSSEGPYATYLARLGRTLAVDVPAVTSTPLPRLPRPAQLRLDIRAGSLDTLDFLAISGCAVQVTIGKRNSSLGRMARPSQRLLLELEYLRLAPECIAYQRARGEHGLASVLQQAWDMKRQQLPALLFNATLGSSEYRSLWRFPTAPGNYPAGTSSRVISALSVINGHSRRWLADDYQADNQAFELLLSEVAAGDGGALLQALARQDDWLHAANSMLDKRLAQGPLCSPGIRPSAAGILPNLIRKYFVGGIQPRAATLGLRYHELLPAIVALEDLLQVGLPPSYRAWQLERDTLLDHLVAAPRRHVAKLIAIQQPCAAA